jgi:hypothetical protein
MSVIARELGVGVYALRRVVDRLYAEGARELAYNKTAKGGVFVYDVEAIKIAAAPHLTELRAKRAAREADQAASFERRVEANIPKEPQLWAASAEAFGVSTEAPQNQMTALLLPPAPSRHPEPEVIVMLKRQSP